MGVLRTLKKWQSGYWKPIGAEKNCAGIAQRLDAVEYELNCLNRDLARIGVTAPPRRASLDHAAD
jgi:hypothetical protein